MIKDGEGFVFALAQNNGSKKGYKQKIPFLAKTGWVGEVLRKNNMIRLGGRSLIDMTDLEEKLLKKKPALWRLAQSSSVQIDDLNKQIPLGQAPPIQEYKNIILRKPTTKKMSILKKFGQMLKTKIHLDPTELTPYLNSSMKPNKYCFHK